MKIGIIGAGASGILCAIYAAQRGYDVVIFERKDRMLKKVLVTGNGTCNFTNINAGYRNYFSIEEKIDERIFNEYSFEDVLSFFKKIGIEYKVEKFGKVYPLSYQASAIVDALRFKVESMKNIEVKYEFEVSKVRKKNLKFNVSSVSNETIVVDKLVIAAGGISYPELGSNGSGYDLAIKMGHSRTEIFPVLVQLKVDKKYAKGLEGVKQKVKLSVYNNNELLRSDENELLFTAYGVSGPCIFNLSYLTALYNLDDLYWNVDFLSMYSEDELRTLLYTRKKDLGYLEIEYYLNGLVNKKFASYLLKSVGIEKLNFKVSEIDDEIIEKLVEKLKKFVFKVYDTTGFSNAQVTAGGIRINEVDNYSLESKIVKGLYFTGEILDVFGDCGGYNLNWCFISGMHVGKNI
ncbi:NAD(P)/FAD-dependent oxidoreductase [Streptobacillus moniliformis]|uniref:HI0933 family protein n=1 Tax=Streptobacillus moniliformis (strain ATCC 14647 / DSM 12112 / NCTC 10651 / 9901) TaxID=519441 RepID=D1AYV7_STRM9|nr:aminoacetone oxidase family FAD-binding enzyme [Streptobacillus moniliformis]ACZ01483.1 HI0933 family protein [Streptobacillus moniliformis DSM 12112]AVL43515.1 aminoacetone oxidase family FAD-binding enzyme [Streptobacillus moniliformis]QXW66165.1 aminoacetone oxidase family FAD-binding enzyme [Streptobacillus moniliformis]SQA13356.1 flavoprotein, HI0933 family [Streptobacillus moniliformis]